MFTSGLNLLSKTVQIVLVQIPTESQQRGKIFEHIVWLGSNPWYN